MAQLFPQLRFDGDKEACKALVPFALNFLNDMKHRGSFRKLKVMKENKVFNDGTVIEVQSVHGLDQVFISSPAVQETVQIPEVPEIKETLLFYITLFKPNVYELTGVAVYSTGRLEVIEDIMTNKPDNHIISSGSLTIFRYKDLVIQLAMDKIYFGPSVDNLTKCVIVSTPIGSGNCTHTDSLENIYVTVYQHFTYYYYGLSIDELYNKLLELNNYELVTFDAVVGKYASWPYASNVVIYDFFAYPMTASSFPTLGDGETTFTSNASVQGKFAYYSYGFRYEYDDVTINLHQTRLQLKKDYWLGATDDSAFCLDSTGHIETLKIDNAILFDGNVVEHRYVASNTAELACDLTYNKKYPSVCPPREVRYLGVLPDVEQQVAPLYWNPDFNKISYNTFTSNQIDRDILTYGNCSSVLNGDDEHAAFVYYRSQPTSIDGTSIPVLDPAWHTYISAESFNYLPGIVQSHIGYMFAYYTSKVTQSGSYRSVSDIPSDKLNCVWDWAFEGKDNPNPRSPWYTSEFRVFAHCSDDTYCTTTEGILYGSSFPRNDDLDGKVKYVTQEEVNTSSLQSYEYTTGYNKQPLFDELNLVLPPDIDPEVLDVSVATSINHYIVSITVTEGDEGSGALPGPISIYKDGKPLDLSSILDMSEYSSAEVYSVGIYAADEEG